MHCRIKLMFLLLIVTLFIGSAHARRYSYMNGAFSANIVALSDEEFEEDTLTYQKKYYYLCEQSPMKEYLEKEDWLAQIKTDEKWVWRGYESHWVIEDEALYLTYFLTTNPKVNAYFKDLVETSHQRMLAYWFTGTLDIKLDKQYGPNYERRYICGSDGNQHTLRLIFEHGLLKQTRRLTLDPQK